MSFASKHCGLNENQYGSRAGNLCHSAILNKILTYDYFQLTKENGATLEFDSQANCEIIILDLFGNRENVWAKHNVRNK